MIPNLLTQFAQKFCTILFCILSLYLKLPVSDLRVFTTSILLCKYKWISHRIINDSFQSARFFFAGCSESLRST